MTTEYDLQKQCVQYIERQFPHIYFYSDLNGVPLHKATAGKVKAIQMKSRKWLDLFFPEPRRGHKGLFIELKKSDGVLYKKGGELRQTEHIQAQQETIEAMKKRGYYAEFITGFDDFKHLIDVYFADDLAGKGWARGVQ